MELIKALTCAALGLRLRSRLPGKALMISLGALERRPQSYVTEITEAFLEHPTVRRLAHSMPRHICQGLTKQLPAGPP